MVRYIGCYNVDDGFGCIWDKDKLYSIVEFSKFDGEKVVERKVVYFYCPSHEDFRFRYIPHFHTEKQISDFLKGRGNFSKAFYKTVDKFIDL